MDGKLQQGLINWGYAIRVAAIRGYVEKDVHEPPEKFPYEVGV